MKDYYVFDGENATTGEPNRITGRLSYWGNILKFKSKQAALDYVDNYRGFGICVIGTVQVMRQYCLGMPVSNFNEYIYNIFYFGE